MRDHYQKLKKYLASFRIPFREDGRLVRGLDYYTKTAFELTSTELGSQDALAGGGRYDLLTAELGGKPTPGVGFAAGIERLLMVLGKKQLPGFAMERPSLYIAAADDESRGWVSGQNHGTKGQRGIGRVRPSGEKPESPNARSGPAGSRNGACRRSEGTSVGKSELKDMKTGASKEILLDELTKSYLAGPS